MTSRQLILPSLFLALSACDSSTVTSNAHSVRYVVEGTSATVSYADGSGNIQISTSGHWEHQYEAAPGATLLLDAASDNADDVTGSIFLDGALFRMERGLSVHLEGSTSNHQSGEIEVRGFIEARTSDRMIPDVSVTNLRINDPVPTSELFKKAKALGSPRTCTAMAVRRLSVA